MSSDTVVQIKDRLNIVEVVGQYVKLRKAGQNYTARCPFHNEKTPSFNVSPSRNAYYCFGCGAKGDIFTFVEHFEGIDFLGALKLLGERAGVAVVFRTDHKEKKDTREKLYLSLEDATAFFEKNLSGEKKVCAYLKGRGLSSKTAALWRLGYARPEWRALFDYLKKKGYSDAEIEAAGLIKKKEKGEEGYYDRFRGRIMFPITDAAGRVIAFTGRVFPDDEKAAKYVNSPETELFSKSHVLYGYDKAKFSIRKYDFSIVVEGQTDVLMSFQAGYTNTVAVSGTALTRDQLVLLRRLSENIVFGFDADSAGAASATKGAALALSLGMDVKIAALPKGRDPADLVQEGKDEWKKVIKHSQHIIDFYLDVLAKETADKRKLRLRVVRRVLPFVALVSNKVDQAHFISRIALRLGVPEEAIRDETMKVPLTDAFPASVEAPLSAEETPDPPRERTEQIERLLAHIIRQNGSADVYRKRLSALVGRARADALLAERALDTTASPAEVFAFELRADTLKGDEREIEDLFLNLEKEHLEEACREIAARMKHAEAEGNHRETDTLVKRLKQKAARLTLVKDRLTGA